MLSDGYAWDSFKFVSLKNMNIFDCLWKYVIVWILWHLWQVIEHYSQTIFKRVTCHVCSIIIDCFRHYIVFTILKKYEYVFRMPDFWYMSIFHKQIYVSKESKHIKSHMFIITSVYINVSHLGRTELGSAFSNKLIEVVITTECKRWETCRYW